MGAFAKSVVVLLLAVSTPLVYRQFANEQTIKFMSQYYSNYKNIDLFLRQSASRLDVAKDYVSDRQNIERLASKLSDQAQVVVDKFNEIKKSFSESPEPNKNEERKKQASKPTTTTSTTTKTPKPDAYKVAQCPGDNNKGKPVRLWTQAELAVFDGKKDGPIYLGFLGTVYDVSSNKAHYGTNGDYNAFAGRDATRAFITGNFTHDLSDELGNIEDHLFNALEGWVSFYEANYPVEGRVTGAFFDAKGCATSALERAQKVMAQLKRERESQEAQEQQLPECNSQWEPKGPNEKGLVGKVWCSEQSGGVSRDWVGVPREYQDAQSRRCVCVNLKDSNLVKALEGKLSVYEGCSPTASECKLPDQL